MSETVPLLGIETEYGIIREDVAESDPVEESMRLLKRCEVPSTFRGWAYSRESTHLDQRGFKVHALAQDEEAFGALVGLARIRLMQGRADEVRELVSGIEQGNLEYDQGQALLTQLEFRGTCESAGGRQVCAERVLAEPDNLEARFTFGCCAAVEGDYETALKEWFAVVTADKNFRQGAAKDALVSVFHLLGRKHPSVGEYPQRLYRTLY